MITMIRKIKAFIWNVRYQYHRKLKRHCFNQMIKTNDPKKAEAFAKRATKHGHKQSEMVSKRIGLVL
jgi:hypothetical protein